MEIKLSTQESEEIFYDALCNAVGNGYMQGYGLELQCDRSQYKDSRDHLIRMADEAELMTNVVCYEDVLLQILKDGGELTMTDHEGDGEYTRSIKLADVHERVQKTPIENLTNIINQNDDATDADCVLQTVFFEDIIFG